MPPPRRLVTLVAVLSSLGSPALADFRVAPFNIAGQPYTSPNGINDAGAVVGSFADANNIGHGFLATGASPGRYVDVVYGTNPDTELYGINNAGVAVGFTIDPAGVGHAFMRSTNGDLSLLPDYSSGATTFAVAINNQGTIAGIESGDNFATASGLIYNPTSGYTKLDFPDADLTIPRAITDAGIVYGWFQTSAQVDYLHGFRYDPFAAPGSQYRQIDVPNEPYTLIYGASFDGTKLAGTVFDDVGTGSHAFLMDGLGTMLLDYPGASDTQGGGVNDSGVMVGTYNNFSGGFIATAVVPEPSTLSLCGIAGMIGFVVSQSRRWRAVDR